MSTIKSNFKILMTNIVLISSLLCWYLLFIKMQYKSYEIIFKFQKTNEFYNPKTKICTTRQHPNYKKACYFIREKLIFLTENIVLYIFLR